MLEGQVRAAEANARQARRLFTHSPQAAFLLTPEGRVLEANVQASLLLGVPASRSAGHRLGKYLTSASQGPFTALLKQVFATTPHATTELVLLTADGTARTVLAAVHRTDADDEAPGCQLVVTNVTSLKQAHHHLLNDVEALQASIQDQTARNQRLEAEVWEVIQGTQLQLNLQLGRLQSALRLHQKEVEAAGGTFTHLEATQDVLRSAFALVESLNQYMEARQLRLRAGSVDLNRVLTEVVKDLQVVLRGRSVQWSSAALPTVQGDGRALRIILREYVSNALKFTRTREVTQLQWQVEETGDHYLIGLQDNGVGFNQRQKDEAFELFGRLHPTGTYEGTGIGLAVVRRLAERGGGRAWGEGKVDQGATFWVACLNVPNRKVE
ncbi:hypothetical protein GCM10010844_44080 [Deinococcus radiotolerans]|uniref:histidine kinase n=1 Tax=Deinococcus radiotolerans TaxID=1309407 RepID=A0ABQ2FRN1_9DEIO|nr:hypothetical protein GCM10010844_44080 [Deinococcus radiotolerans]